MDQDLLPKAYDPAGIEKHWYSFWEKEKLFHADDNKKGKEYSMVIPPPNVTGSLHMGHALNNTLQDILIRYYRMNNYNTLWMPGTDHAGIATQNVVEKQLALEGLKREDLGRDKFINAYGTGKRIPEGSLSISSRDWAARVIGIVSVSLWTLGCPVRCERYLFSSMKTV